MTFKPTWENRRWFWYAAFHKAV